MTVQKTALDPVREPLRGGNHMRATDTMVEAACREYRASDLDGKALVRAMLNAALAANEEENES